MRDLWPLSPEATFLNHGSFGACPRVVLEYQQKMQDRLETAPVPFLVGELPDLLDQARRVVADFVGAKEQDLVFVRNATEAVNTVLAGFPLRGRDEVLTTGFGYPACLKAAHRWCQRSGAILIEAALPWPLQDPHQVLEALNNSVTERTKLLMVDHVTSGSGLVFPLPAILDWAARRGLPVLVDGAHAPGMVELDLDRWKAQGLTFYTGNLHKWCCAPKGAAFLWVHPDWAQRLHPLTTSHGDDRGGTRPLLWARFDWTGTDDPTAWLAAAHSVTYLDGLVPGGWSEIRRRNREMVQRGARIVDDVLNTGVAPPKGMLGSLWTLPLTGAPEDLGARLWQQERLDTFINRLSPRAGPMVLRLSAHLYNTEQDYERLAAVLLRTLPRRRGRE